MPPAYRPDDPLPDDPLRRALLKRLHDEPELRRRLREVVDDAEAAGKISPRKAAYRRAQIDALDKEIEEGARSEPAAGP